LTQHSGAVSRVLWLTLGANLTVAVCKLIFGFMSGLASVIADGYHSLLDASSNLVGLVGIRISAAPPDDDHPYGHQKFEIFSSMGIALLLFVAAYNIVGEAMERWQSSEVHESLSWGYPLLGMTLVVTYLLQRWQRKKARELSSVILHADSEHTRSDFLATLGALMAVIALESGLSGSGCHRGTLHWSCDSPFRNPDRFAISGYSCRQGPSASLRDHPQGGGIPGGSPGQGCSESGIWQWDLCRPEHSTGFGSQP